MIIEDGLVNLEENLFRQLSIYWGEFHREIILEKIEEALLRLSNILVKLKKTNKYVWIKDSKMRFSPYHSVQYSIFLYLLANTIYNSGGGIREAEILYYLNKIMHSCDWYYAIDLPKLFYAEHPIGSVLGRARYGNYFFFYQGTTVGGQRDKNGKLHYPKIGDNVLMYANSSILGNCVIGDHVIISSNTNIKNENISNNCIVFGQSPNLVIKKRSQIEILSMQEHIWENFND